MTLANQHLAIGVALTLVAWAYCYVCGSLLRAPRLSPDWDPAAFRSEDALLDVLLTTTAGIAVVGFATFVAGLLGVIYPVTLLAFLVLFGGVAGWLGDNPLRGSFWSRRLAVVRKALQVGPLIVFAAAVLIAVPAVLPDNGSDATVYHHAYAFDWAAAHRIYTDWWLRAPFYANNWVLLATWVYELNGVDYVQFLTWFSGLLTMLTIYAFVARAAPFGRRGDGTRATALALAAVVPVAIAPTFLHLVVLSYIDVPIGLFFLATAAAALLCVVQGRRYALIDAIVIGAFFVGMKISLIAFLPLLVAVVLMALRRTTVGKRFAAAALTAAIVLSLPWYARNFVLDGDPVPPMLNLAIVGKDGAFSKADFANGVGAIGVDKSTHALLQLPWSAFVQPGPLQDVGLCLLIVLLWLPAFVVAYGLLTRRSIATWEIGVAGAMLLFAYAYWTETSYYLRYALVFYPLLSAFAGALAASFMRGRFVGAAAAGGVLAMLTFAIPPPAAAQFYQSVWINEYQQIGAVYAGRKSWLEGHMPGYREVEYVSVVFRESHRRDLRLYRLNLETLTLNFKMQGIDAIGEWWGPERYNDFRLAIDRNDIGAYVRRFHLGAFMMAQPGMGTILTRDEFEQFQGQMRELGYSQAQFPASPYVLFFSRELGRLPPLQAIDTVQ